MEANQTLLAVVYDRIWELSLPLEENGVFRELIDEDPANASAHIGLALASASLGDFAVAWESLDRAQQLIRRLLPAESVLDKLVLGWNIGSRPRLDRLFAAQGYQLRPNEPKSIDIWCRLRVPDTAPEWYRAHRKETLRRLGALGSRVRVVTSGQKIPFEQYIEEVRRSRITVSPFGWGEVCYRDFEAVICGSVSR